MAFSVFFVKGPAHQNPKGFSASRLRRCKLKGVFSVLSVKVPIQSFFWFWGIRACMGIRTCTGGRYGTLSSSMSPLEGSA
eukprot:138664-Chlamydomonas_euryale.AAC.1